MEDLAGDSAAWRNYLAIILFAFCMQLMSTLAMLLDMFALLREVLRRRGSSAIDGEKVAEPVAVVVPCYLPNEAPIIKETVVHLLENMVDVEELRVYLVYNTPKWMAIEDDLQALATSHKWPSGRHLFVHRVDGSKSKAENLNFIISTIREKYTVIYDADHHPDPPSLAMAVKFLELKGVDCVQGSTYIRDGSWLLRTYIHAEFFVSYFVVLPMMERLAGTGFFGGANGIWRTAAVQKMKFDPEVLTEDIDFCVRGILKHHLTFAFLPDSRSGELAPSSCSALWKQRLRWAMGWDQVSTTYASGFCAEDMSWRQRVGLIYIFVCRWLTQFCTVIIVAFNLTSSLQSWLWVDPDSSGLVVPAEIHTLQNASAYLYGFMILWVLARVLVHEPSLQLLCGVSIYFATMPAYLLFTSLVLLTSLVRVARGRTGTWVVTARSGASAPMVEANKPLLPQQQTTAGDGKSQNLAAALVLALGLVMQGATFGSLVGACFGRHRVEHPKWGWVPFGIGATYSTTIDGEAVAEGACIGVLVAVASCIVLLLCPKQSG